MNRVCEMKPEKPRRKKPQKRCAASLIKSIDSCEVIVNELARGYEC